MNDARTIGVVTAEQGYDGILAVLRERANELKASRQVLGEIAGLQPGYMEKLLAGIKALGKESTGPTLGVLGLKIAFIEDEAALARVASRLTARDQSQVRMLPDGKHPGFVVRLTLRRMRKLAKLGGAARARKLTKRRRKQIAKQAAKARWHKPIIVEVIDEAEKAAILEQEHARGAPDRGPGADAHEPARPQRINARPSKRRPQA